MEIRRLSSQQNFFAPPLSPFPTIVSSETVLSPSASFPSLNSDAAICSSNYCRSKCRKRITGRLRFARTRARVLPLLLIETLHDALWLFCVGSNRTGSFYKQHLPTLIYVVRYLTYLIIHHYIGSRYTLHGLLTFK